MNLFDRLRRQVQSLGHLNDHSDAETPNGDVPSAASSTDAAAVAPAASLVIGLFSSDLDAEQALNNLDEAGYDKTTISLIAADPRRAQTIANASGPLSSLSPSELAAALGARGLAGADAAAYQTAIEAGSMCIAVDAPSGSEQSAGEILGDDHGQQVHILPGSNAQ